MTDFDLLQTFFVPDWTLVREGWQGFANHFRLMSTVEVQEYASEQLAKAEGEQVVNISYIAFANEDDTQWIAMQLAELASENLSQVLLARRKWRFILLNKMLTTVDGDPIYDIIKFTEFWASFEYPDDSPYKVQSRGNNIRPQNFYTYEHLQSVIGEHKDWLINEYKTLVPA